MKKKYLLLLIIVSFNLSVFSQFEKIIPHQMQVFGGLVVETSTNDYIIVVDDWFIEESQGSQTLFKISQNGETLDSSYLTGINLRGDMININNNEILLSGRGEYFETPENTVSSPILLKIDEDLNILSTNTLPLPIYFPIDIPAIVGLFCKRLFPTKTNNLLVLTSFGIDKNILYELNSNFDTIQTKRTINSNFIFPPLILNNNNDSSFYTFLHNDVFKFNKNLECTDTLMDSFGNYEIDYYLNNLSTVKYLNDNRILMYFGMNDNTLYSKSSANDREIGVFIVDTLFNLKKFVQFGYSTDTLDMPVYRRNGIDFTDQNNIFCVSVINHPTYFAPTPKEEITSIMISVLDSNLNIKNQTFYGGDDRYLPYDIKATSDGGCIIISGKYELYSGNDYAYIHLLKVNENGELSPPISNEEINNSTMKLAFIYPNPSKDFINVRYGAHLKNVSIEIFDISGKKIFVKNLENPISKIDIQNFKIGSYVYHILNDNKIIEKGKIIKE